MERRVPSFVISHSKRFRVGKPGGDLGINDPRHFLVISESSDWVTDKSSKRLRNIFRHAIIRVCLAIVRRKVMKNLTIDSSPSDTLTASQVTRLATTSSTSVAGSNQLARTKSMGNKEKKTSEMRFDILQSRVRVMNALTQTKDSSKPDEVAEKLVDTFEHVSYYLFIWRLLCFCADFLIFNDSHSASKGNAAH